MVNEAGSTEVTQLAERVLAFINTLLNNRNITPNAVQEPVSYTHLTLPTKA